MLKLSIIVIIIGISWWKVCYDGKHRAMNRNDWDTYSKEIKGMHKGQIVLVAGIVLLFISFSL